MAHPVNTDKPEIFHAAAESWTVDFDRWKRQLMKLFPREAYAVPGNNVLFRCWEAKQTPEQTAFLIRQAKKTR